VQQRNTTEKGNDITAQLLVLRHHVETHECSECRKLFHKLANSIHVAVFGRKLAKAKTRS
jgi:predicted anti-sigma-YlaC factor YlaD